MRKCSFLSRTLTIQFQVCLLIYLLVLTCSGCVYIDGCSPKAQCQRTVQLSAPLAPGWTFEAETHNGPITINGAEVADCNLTAIITAGADSQERAKALADQVQVMLLPSNNRLTVKIRTLALLKCAYVSVSLDAIVPSQLNLELTTHNGAVKISDITGDIDATTHNGKIEAAYSQAAKSDCSISLITHNGSIDFTTPPNFSAKVKAATHNGSIKTSLPVTVIGELDKRNLTGTIGTGEPRGDLHLETHNGSINIR